MSKVNFPITNDYCPQTLFAYGTFREDGSPNFGQFCWFTYFVDGGLGAIAALGGSKLTLDRIHAAKMFSANLVTEKLLPLTDYFGCTPGYTPGKMDVPFAWERGHKLDVPVLTDSPIAFELEVLSEQEMPSISPTAEGSVIFVCRVVNVLGDETLLNPDETLESKMARIAPVSATQSSYLGWKGDFLGAWGDSMAMLNK